MSTQTLRELAKEYAKGNIDKDTYRKSRTDLIQGIISGKIAVKAIDYVEPLKQPQDIEEAITEGINRERDTTQIISPNQRPEQQADAFSAAQEKNLSDNNKISPLVFIIASTVIVISLIIAVVLFYPKPPEPTVAEKSDNSSSVNNTSSNAAEQAVSTNSVAADSLIASFLNEKNWNESSLNNFINSWNELTQEQKDASAETKRMQRLKSTLYKQFMEGKALASIDAEKAIEKQQKLIDFANAIGIEDSRLVIDN